MEIEIIGNLTPEVGVAEKYTVKKVLEAFDTEPLKLIPEHTDAEIKWNIYVLDANVWRLAKVKEKKGESVEYKFSEISPKFKDIAMIVEAYGKETMIHIKPQPTSQPKITFIELLDVHKKEPKKGFAYGNWIIARVHCVGMELRPIVVTLWENDGDKHKLNTKNLKIDTQKKFVKRGFADIKFYLDPMHANLANSKADKGESDEGKFHEYYVTAEIAGKEESRRATLDTHVANPDYVEKKLVVSPTIGFPVREVINSLMMVDMTPQSWWPFNEEKEKNKNGICESEAKVRAFMRMLRVKEDTVGDEGYEKIVGGKSFIKDYGKDWSTHPQIIVYIKRIDNYSSAAGAYQCLSTTFNEIVKNYGKKYQVSNFNKESQDKICLIIMKHYYKDDRPASFYDTKNEKAKEWRKRFKNQQADIIQLIIDGEIKRATLLSSLCWASLPDSPYGQQSSLYTFDDVKKIYDKYLKEELISPSKELHLKQGFLKEFGYSCCDDSIVHPEGKGWNIDVHLWSDRKVMGYGILILKDKEGNETWRTIVRAQGFTNTIGGLRTQELSDTPTGTYKFEQWRNDGRTDIYGPNKRLDMTYESGEAKKAGREEIQIHGGRQDGDPNAYLWNTGGCLRVFDDAIDRLRKKIENLELEENIKDNHFINVFNTLKFDENSKKYYTPNDYNIVLKNPQNKEILQKGITHKKYYKNESNYYTNNFND